MRRETPTPCSGSSASAFKISRSSVPRRRSVRFLPIYTLLSASDTSTLPAILLFSDMHVSPELTAAALPSRKLSTSDSETVRSVIGHSCGCTSREIGRVAARSDNPSPRPLSGNGTLLPPRPQSRIVVIPSQRSGPSRMTWASGSFSTRLYTYVYGPTRMCDAKVKTNPVAATEFVMPLAAGNRGQLVCLRH